MTLLRLILELDDVKFLKQTKKIVFAKSQKNSDWANEINESQIEMNKLGEEQIIKFEELISTGPIKFQYSKIIGHKKCVIDQYNSILLSRDNDRIQIVALIDNRSDHHF